MKRIHRNIAIITTTLLGINAPMAMENPEANYFQGVAKATETLAMSVFNATPDQNTISCALGPVQLFGTVYQALTTEETGIKQEIESLLGHSITADGQKQFKSLVAGESTHNALFLNNQYIMPANQGINQDAVEALSGLGSAVVPLDFCNGQESADTINKIVEADTKGMIKDLAQPSHFSPLTKVVLLSTLYVKAKWDAKFREDRLYFRNQSGSKKVDGFTGEGWMYYSETAENQFLTIPASNKTYLMIKMTRMDNSVFPITTAEWNEDNVKSEYKYTELTMPKFTIENTLDLTGHLTNSLPTLLGSEFKTTLTDLPLYVSKFLQKNKIVVNKDGLEAASATMMGMNAKCMPPEVTQQVVVDRLFSYLLYKGIGINPQTKGSNNFLFLFSGTVVDLTQGL